MELDEHGDLLQKLEFSCTRMAVHLCLQGHFPGGNKFMCSKIKIHSIAFVRD